FVTYNRAPILNSQPALDCLASAYKHTHRALPFFLDAYCVLPDHLHVLVRLPQDDADYSLRARTFKVHFTRAYLASGGKEQSISASGAKRRERAIWQRRFWERTIREVD